MISGTQKRTALLIQVAMVLSVMAASNLAWAGTPVPGAPSRPSGSSRKATRGGAGVRHKIVPRVSFADARAARWRVYACTVPECDPILVLPPGYGMTLWTLDELRLGFMPTEETPLLDLQHSPDGVRTSSFLGGSGDAFSCKGKTARIQFQNLRIFKDYHARFMQEHSGPLSRDAHAAEFETAFAAARAEYRRVVDEARSQLWFMDIPRRLTRSRYAVAQQAFVDTLAHLIYFDVAAACSQIERGDPYYPSNFFRRPKERSGWGVGPGHSYQWASELLAWDLRDAVLRIPMSPEKADAMMGTIGPGAPVTLRLYFQITELMPWNVRYMDPDKAAGQWINTAIGYAPRPEVVGAAFIGRDENGIDSVLASVAASAPPRAPLGTKNPTLAALDDREAGEDLCGEKPIVVAAAPQVPAPEVPKRPMQWVGKLPTGGSVTFQVTVWNPTMVVGKITTSEEGLTRQGAFSWSEADDHSIKGQMTMDYPRCPFTGTLSGTKGADDSLVLDYRGTETCAGKRVFKGTYRLTVRLYEGEAVR